MNKTVKLFNGYLMPQIGLGTWQSPPAEVEAAVEVAITCGYRHIDTAAMYANEDSIGTAVQKLLKSGAVKREELFIVTKLWSNMMRASDVERGLKACLKNLQLDYLDLFLLHTPVGVLNEGDDVLMPTNADGSVKLDMTTDHEAIWKAMEKQVDAGLTRSIGISNFNEKQITKIMSCARIQPACNQVEIHARFQQRPLVQHCRKHNITVVAYAPLGSPGRKMDGVVIPNLLGDPTVAAIAKSHNKTPGQVLLNHLASKDIIVLAKSTNPARILQNLESFDFNLSEEEVQQLDALDAGLDGRTFIFSQLFKGIETHPEYSFEQLRENKCSPIQASI